MSMKYQVNVKIPEKYVKIIDLNLGQGMPLATAGFKGRAHFVRTAVKEKLIGMGLLLKEETRF